MFCGSSNVHTPFSVKAGGCRRLTVGETGVPSAAFRNFLSHFTESEMYAPRVHLLFFVCLYLLLF